jgi:hypothetical protein
MPPVWRAASTLLPPRSPRTTLHPHRHTQAIGPRIKAVLYTWTAGRRTAEGEDAELAVQVGPGRGPAGLLRPPAAPGLNRVQRALGMQARMQTGRSRRLSTGMPPREAAWPATAPKSCVACTQPSAPQRLPSPPASRQELTVHYRDPMLLMPVVCEHAIDERSPLYGHTHDSLEASGRAGWEREGAAGEGRRSARLRRAGACA